MKHLQQFENNTNENIHMVILTMPNDVSVTLLKDKESAINYIFNAVYDWIISEKLEYSNDIFSSYENALEYFNSLDSNYQMYYDNEEITQNVKLDPHNLEILVNSQKYNL